MNDSTNGQNGPQVDQATISQAVDIIATETMVGDLRDFVLDRLRHDHNALPWHLRGEAAQRKTIESVTEAVRAAVEKVVRIIATDGRAVITATLAQCTVKDEIKAVCVLNKSDELRHVLLDSVGLPVLIAVADASRFTGARGEVEINRDQPGLFGEEGDATGSGRGRQSRRGRKGQADEE